MSVMTRIPTASPFHPATTGGVRLQRSCACAKTSSGGGACDGCRRKQGELQRRVASRGAVAEAPGTAPPIVHEVLRSPGHALDGTTRSLMESRFGHDFSSVRIHTGARADESARSINALAYTVGGSVVFGSGQYAPWTASGAQLLAHELTHVVQQGGHAASAGHGPLRLGDPDDRFEHEANLVATQSGTGSPTPAVAAYASVADARTVQRKLVVNPADVIPLPPGALGPALPLTVAVQGLLGDTCPDGHFQVDSTTGTCTPANATFCQEPPPGPPFMAPDVSSTPVGCHCLCDVINNTQTTTVAFQTAGGPSTRHPKGVGGPKQDPTVSVDPRFKGQYLINGRWVDIPFHLIFAHEICGHALPAMRGTHPRIGPAPPGGTPPHERLSVDVERQIAAEHNPPLPRRPEDYGGGARQAP